MTRLFVILLAAGAIALGSFGADAATKKVVRSLDPAKGYFHQLHTKKMKMACTGCHSTEMRDILFLRKDDVVPAAMPGQVDRAICLGCHTAPSKPAWYGLSSAR